MINLALCCLELAGEEHDRVALYDRGSEVVADQSHARAPAIGHRFEDALEESVGMDLIVVRHSEDAAEEAEQFDVACEQSMVQETLVACQEAVHLEKSVGGQSSELILRRQHHRTG